MRRSIIIEWAARVLAILGGVVLVAITVLTVASIIGRSLVPFGLGPVPGDFELVEAGTAFAVFAFLPWCQLNRGHATVDVFTSFLSPRSNRIIDVISDGLMTLVMLLIAWRLWDGTLDKIRYGETTFILQFPIWWAYALSEAAAIIAVVVSFYIFVLRIAEAASGRAILPTGEGVQH